MGGHEAISAGGGAAAAGSAGAAVRLLLHGDMAFERACAELERELRARPPLQGAAVTLRVQRPLSAPELRHLEEMLLDRHGAQLLQVVEAEPPAAAGGLDTPAAGDGRRAVRRLPWRTAGVAAATRPRTPTGPRKAGADGPPARALGAPSGLGEAVPTMLIKRTLRSGQRVRFAGNVVVLGDVNPGAEIVAAGDIVVMGTLRGVAHAGATGRLDAIVAAFRLYPTQIRVGSVIGRAPDGQLPRPDVPEVARVRDGTLVVERYTPQ